MILTRKIITPALVLFALLLFGLLGYIFITYQASNAEEEQRFLAALSNGYGSEVDNQQKIALILALEIANNPQTQEAFAQQDREKLLAITSPIYERIRLFNVTQLQFHNPPGISFLRVNKRESFGDDLTTYRPLIVEVNKNQQPLTGIEANQSGVGIHGIVPVYYQEKYIGSLEVGIDAGNFLLGHLVEEYGNEWHILLTEEAASIFAPDTSPNYQISPISELLLNTSTAADPIFNSPDGYRKALLNVGLITNTKLNGRNYAIISKPISDHSGKTIGILDIVTDRTDVVALQNRRLLIGGFAGLLVLVLGGFGITLFTTRALSPIGSLTAAAKQIAQGNLSTQIDNISRDEVGDLSTAFNSMAAQVLESISTLEGRVSIRTSDLERNTLELETISDVAREIATIRDVNTLLNVSANLIRERFNYYHTAIFLLDDRGESAILQAASGAAAQQLIEQRYRLNIDPRNDLGTTLREGQAYVSLDVSKDLMLTRNPLLPETISEIVLPLRVLGKTIGVLDIQSNRSINFDERNIKTLGLLVDQLAAAIENARLLQRVEGTVNELNKAYRLETQKAWQTTVQERAVTAYEYDGQQIRPIPNNLPIELKMQLDTGKAVVIKEKIGIQDGTNNVLLIPIMVLNQLIGVIGLEQKEPNHAWTNEEIAVAEAAANRAALTLENARLIEDSQRRALKERTISDATGRIGSALNLENILDITAKELERIIGNSEVILQIDTGSRPSNET